MLKFNKKIRVWSLDSFQLKEIEHLEVHECTETPVYIVEIAVEAYINNLLTNTFSYLYTLLCEHSLARTKSVSSAKLPPAGSSPSHVSTSFSVLQDSGAKVRDFGWFRNTLLPYKRCLLLCFVCYRSTMLLFNCVSCSPFLSSVSFFAPRF